MFRITVNIWMDHPKNCCNYPKIWTIWFYHSLTHPKDVCRMANSVNPDQNLLQEQSYPGLHCSSNLFVQAPSGAVSSGSTLFAQTCLADKLVLLQ